MRSPPPPVPVQVYKVWRPGRRYAERWGHIRFQDYLCKCLFCSPNCTYTWFFMGRSLIGSTLTLDRRDRKVDQPCTVLRLPEASIFTTSNVEIRSNAIKSIFQMIHLSKMLHHVTSFLIRSYRPCFCAAQSAKHCPNSQPLVGCGLRWWQYIRSPFWPIKPGAPRMDKKWCWLRIMPGPQLPSDGGFYQRESSVSKQTSVLSRGDLLSCKYSKTRMTLNVPTLPRPLWCSIVDLWNLNIGGPDVWLFGELSCI